MSDKKNIENQLESINSIKKTITNDSNHKNLSEDSKEELQCDLNIKNQQNEHDIISIQEELNQVKNNLLDTKLRAQAEIENIRRRTQIDIEKIHKFALEKFINELLPVVDSLERALESAKKENIALSSMIEGINLTLKSLISTMNKFGVEVINQKNVPFNPEVHQAMSLVESKNDELSNHVIQIVQTGYTLNGRLLRPAMVIVSKKS